MAWSIRLLLFVGLTLWVLSDRVLQAESPSPESPSRQSAPRFERDVAPIFKSHCVKCHNADSMKAELDLSSPQAVFRGSESGPILTLGKAKESLLFEMIADGSMPPEDEKSLTKQQIETIRQWIAAGTPFVGKVDPRELLAGAEVNNHDIEPLMLLRCAVCHGLRKKEAGLDLRTKTSMLKGGKSGPAIVLGKPNESLVVKRIRSGEMPPNKHLIIAGVKPMPSGELDKLARWITLGVPEVEVKPDVATSNPDPLVSDKDRQFWSFQSPRDVEIPHVTDARRIRNPIDAFVAGKLKSVGLEFSADSDKLTLLRRACFDLTGLPPTPDDVVEFLADDDPLAYERLIDRLLASPRYGERWGRMWMDVAGYADSEGKRSADPIRPNAWKYRDYVIRAFNADKSYDRLLLEQIAGDELAEYDKANEITPQIRDNLIATGFLRMAPDGTGSDVVNRVPERMEVVADEIDIFSSGVLGLTMKCARCHSHKYDPIPQRDYYRLVDVFKGALDVHDWLKPAFVPGQTKAVKPGRVLEIATQEELREQEQFNLELDEKIAAERKKLDKLAERLRKQHLEEQLAKLPAELHDPLRKMLATKAEKRTAEQIRLAEEYEKQLTLTKQQVAETTEYKAESRNVNLRVKALEGQKQANPQIRALWDRGDPSPTYVYLRGDHRQVGRLVGPGVPSVLTDGETPFIIEAPWPAAKQSGRRLALAKWLTQPDHPLTARVMVNRIWKHHFGQGIVKSLGNFGKLGTAPTHPDLLDWLAREFVRRDWSIKEMHRLMMTSTTYRQVSAVDEKRLQLDPDNSLLSRMPLRRLDAEEVRDALLMVCGRLNSRPFGRPDSVEVRKDGLVTSKPTGGGWRRSIYIQHRRKELLTVLEIFDQPQMNPNCQQRTTSTVAHEALYLTNNEMVRQLSRSFAEQTLRLETDPRRQVDLVYLSALGRLPSGDESTLGVAALKELSDQWRAHLAATEQEEILAPTKALATYCHTILNSAEFLYVD